MILFKNNALNSRNIVGNSMTKISRKHIGLLLISSSLFLGACTKEDPAVTLTMDTDLNQAVFTTPEIAAQAFTNAVTDRNRDKLGKILGLTSGQLLPLNDIKPETIEKYLKAYSLTHELKAESEEQKILSVGKKDWTLPIPIVKGATGWYFDSKAGKNRIRIRRIGRNELAVMQVVLAYHDAQIDFATIDRNANGEREYAQQFISSENVHDGLYWETADGEALSPLGSLFVNDTPEGAYHGYYYRILTSQSDAAKGGAEDYIVDSRMTGGFALIAWPAVYGRTGVMSFIVNHDGIVYQQNLGQDTAETARNTLSFNPSDQWAMVTK
ncbi:MAG: DUF2950 domain-containing protein [Gammaproteobacteria bacterium]|nr:DUF2950 domain-containing protein [Gammaproteobacteria bacterium]